jgi:hypothetical protein
MSTQRPVKIFLITVALVGAALLLPLLIGVWLPDVFLGRPQKIASLRLADSTEFEVVQYWNHVDFYTTELRCSLADGQRKTWVLDGDDRKRWHIPISVDESAGTVSVAHDGANLKTIKW